MRYVVKVWSDYLITHPDDKGKWAFTRKQKLADVYINRIEAKKRAKSLWFSLPGETRPGVHLVQLRPRKAAP